MVTERPTFWKVGPSESGLFSEEVGSHVFVFTLVLNAGDLLHGKVVGGRAHRGGWAGEEIAVGGKGEASNLAHAARARMGGASGSWMRTCGVDSNQYSAVDRWEREHTDKLVQKHRGSGGSEPGHTHTHWTSTQHHRYRGTITKKQSKTANPKTDPPTRHTSSQPIRPQNR